MLTGKMIEVAVKGRRWSPEPEAVGSSPTSPANRVGVSINRDMLSKTNSFQQKDSPCPDICVRAIEPKGAKNIEEIRNHIGRPFRPVRG